MKFGQLILRRIVKIVATKCQILRLKCTKIDFGLGSARDPAGELTALPETPSWISGALLLREGDIGREVKGRWRGKGGGEGKGGKEERGGDARVYLFIFVRITYDAWLAM